MKDDLIGRLEAATELTLELFVEAQAHIRPDINDEDWARSYAMVQAGAYESAALTLVPEGWAYEARQGPSGQPHIWDLLTIKSGDVRYTRVTGRAKTPALAIVIAALRAQP